MQSRAAFIWSNTFHSFSHPSSMTASLAHGFNESMAMPEYRGYKIGEHRAQNRVHRAQSRIRRAQGRGIKQRLNCYSWPVASG